MPSASDIFALIDHSWPPAKMWQEGPWTFRKGSGGFKRTMAATATGKVTASDLARAEDVMTGMDQPPMVQIRGTDAALDEMLGQAGYVLVDQCTIYAAPATDLTGTLPLVTAWATGDPLGCQRDIWSEGGIGPGRVEIMERASSPKTAILGRLDDTPCGAAFVSAHGDMAMIHAVEVRQAYRQRGLARYMMTAAANWGVANGVAHLTLICTTQNVAANALYTSMGMQVVGQYHYRIKQ